MRRSAPRCASFRRNPRHSRPALRGLLYEFGHAVPQGFRHLKGIEAIVEDSTATLPDLVRNECRDLLLQISEKSARIEVRTKAARKLAETTDTARRLQTMPGVGPMTALAVEAFAPDLAAFRCGRDFAAWLGLVPRQHSSGGRERLGRVSKAGQADIRKLLIIGAMARLTVRGCKSVREGSWLGRMLARKPKMLVAIALANRIARQLWAMMTKREDFREPVVAGAA